MRLLAGLSIGPLAPGDESAVARVIAASQLHDIGEVAIEEADIVSDWQRPSYDVAANTIGVFDDERLVGYADSPEEIGATPRSIPSTVAEGSAPIWRTGCRRRLVERGLTEIGMPVPQGSPGDLLLERLGYRVRWTSWCWRFRNSEYRGPAVAVRPHDQDGDRGGPPYRAVWTVIEDAFLEWSVRDRQSFEDFSAQVMRRPGFEPWHLRVATDETGSVVGARSSSSPTPPRSSRDLRFGRIAVISNWGRPSLPIPSPRHGPTAQRSPSSPLTRGPGH